MKAAVLMLATVLLIGCATPAYRAVESECAMTSHGLSTFPTEKWS